MDKESLRERWLPPWKTRQAQLPPDCSGDPQAERLAEPRAGGTPRIPDPGSQPPSLQGGQRTNQTPSVSQQDAHIPGASWSREQHINLGAFPTEAGIAGW